VGTQSWSAHQTQQAAAQEVQQVQRVSAHFQKLFMKGNTQLDASNLHLFKSHGCIHASACKAHGKLQASHICQQHATWCLESAALQAV
jgi:hypothetical protein